MTVLSAGREIATPVSREAFDRVVHLLSAPSLSAGTLVPTGIKVIDVMCPLVAGGTLAIAGEWKAGTAVLLEELVRRLSGGTARVSIFTFVPGGGPMTYGQMLEKDGFSEGTVGAVQTFFFRREDGPWTPESLATLASLDVVIRLSTTLAGLGVYPPVDPLTSRSHPITSRSRRSTSRAAWPRSRSVRRTLRRKEHLPSRRSLESVTTGENERAGPSAYRPGDVDAPPYAPSMQPRDLLLELRDIAPKNLTPARLLAAGRS